MTGGGRGREGDGVVRWKSWWPQVETVCAIVTRKAGQADEARLMGRGARHQRRPKNPSSLDSGIGASFFLLNPGPYSLDTQVTSVDTVSKRRRPCLAALGLTV